MSRPMPPHGSWARYLGCKSRPACRCRTCVQGTRRARKRDDFRRAQGISGLVPAAPVAAHLRALVKAGRSFDGIAREAGVNVKTVSNAHAVRSPTLWRSTAAKLMSVRVSPDLTALVDATGAIRRLRALVAMGHSQQVLADGMPCAYTYISMLTHGRRVQVTVATDLAVKRLYGRLSMTPGGSGRGRAYATKYGWDGPLAWDDDTIDDPSAVPDRGEQVPRFVELAENGFELEEQHGFTREQAAARLGVSKDALQKSMGRYRAAQSEAGTPDAYVTRERIMSQNQMEEAA
ncbi:hypothetical protein ACFYNF_34275 [Streptomyces sp. NPDC006641]|uniref:hypothetical protein n=1 Tax=unclassified Streptomyces TaxID=2593676 RepID=UPI0036B416E8